MDALVRRSEDAGSGRWALTEWRPPRLGGLVESIWDFEGAMPHPRERHFPSGLLDLVLQLDERFYFLAGERRELCATACLAGLQSGPTAIEAPPRASRVLGIRLRPAGAHRLLSGAPLSEASERILDLADLVGSPARELVAEIAAASGYSDQPHMNLEFRELGGLAPGDFLAAERYSPTSAVG
jgi:AraC-like DNA-binding protein